MSNLNFDACLIKHLYLTIRLLALYFYEVMIRAKPESTITLYKSRASNLIVLVESVIKHKILHKNIEKRELEVTFF